MTGFSYVDAIAPQLHITTTCNSAPRALPRTNTEEWRILLCSTRLKMGRFPRARVEQALFFPYSITSHCANLQDELVMMDI